MRLSVRTDPKFLKTETIFQPFKFKPKKKKKKKKKNPNKRTKENYIKIKQNS